MTMINIMSINVQFVVAVVTSCRCRVEEITRIACSLGCGAWLEEREESGVNIIALPTICFASIYKQ